MPVPSSPTPASPHPPTLRRGPRARPLRPVALVTGAVAALLAATGCTPVTGPAGASASAVSSAAAPQPAPTESLLTESPDTHSSVGSLAEGFPVDLVPVPDGAEVLVSSAARAGDTDLWDVSLNLRTAQDAAGLVDVYRQHLVAAGFVETTPEHAEPGLAAQATFSRSDGAEILVLGVLDRDGVRTMTLGGRVRTGS
ncbi:MAG TPA: hypothetical protein VFW79_12040 [Cellulomonas sp.]|uniref:hypothetical protein n=1 Tax=Cellulomonas sp. TaxID=40001 RepID=UPI002E34087D|nr:hypothetical protein [Cellulomonas sp.]HEX5333363.1 hypothetical protein [Cellulomonas sp.]